jgi:hypothetical protein
VLLVLIPAGQPHEFVNHRTKDFKVIEPAQPRKTRFTSKEQTYLPYFAYEIHSQMTEKDLRKLEGTIRSKMEDVRKQRVSLRDSGLGGLMNSLKKADEALYDKILPDYKVMVRDFNIFK